MTKEERKKLKKFYESVEEKLIQQIEEIEEYNKTKPFWKKTVDTSFHKSLLTLCRAEKLNQ